jgi:hypothetical protein
MTSITHQESAAEGMFRIVACVVIDYAGSNIAAVSLPAIGRSLSASFTDVQWIISGYVFTYVSLLLASGSYA